MNIEFSGASNEIAKFIAKELKSIEKNISSGITKLLKKRFDDKKKLDKSYYRL